MTPIRKLVSFCVWLLSLAASSFSGIVSRSNDLSQFRVGWQTVDIITWDYAAKMNELMISQTFNSLAKKTFCLSVFDILPNALFSEPVVNDKVSVLYFYYYITSRTTANIYFIVIFLLDYLNTIIILENNLIFTLFLECCICWPDVWSVQY